MEEQNKKEMGEPNKKDMEEQQLPPLDDLGAKALPYPKAIIFLVGTEFCERFSYFGMKAILAIYMVRELKFSEDRATSIFHTYATIATFSIIFGAIVADQCLGRYKTILYSSLIYSFGHFVKTIADIPSLNLPQRAFTFLGLFFIGFGGAGIKPNVVTYGADQFKLPEQEEKLQSYFQIFYFAVNVGALASMWITPILREDVHCLGKDNCYALAFGVPAIIMLCAAVLFIVGTRLYVNMPPQGNLIPKFLGSIFTSIGKKFVSNEKKEHWMDHAKEKYGESIVEDTKVVLRLVVLYIPVPWFWTLFEQQGTRWTFQAQRANGQLGSYTIKPEQMQVVNPLMILVMIPLFNLFIYPKLGQYGLLKKPLQKMVVGGIFAAIAFFVTGFLELSMEKTYERLPKARESHLHVLNTLNCPIVVNLEKDAVKDYNHGIDKLSSKVIFDLEASITNRITVRPSSQIANCAKYKESIYSFKTVDKAVTEVIVLASSDQITVTEIPIKGDPAKTNNGYPKLRFMLDYPQSEKAKIKVQSASGGSFELVEPHVKKLVGQLSGTEYEKMPPSVYTIWVDSTNLETIKFLPGGVHTLVVTKPDTGDALVLNDFLLSKENTVHMLWLIPQYVIITAGEILFSIPWLEFTFIQAPMSMKSVMMGIQGLTIAIGHLFVTIVAEAKFFESRAAEFFMYAILMLVDMAIFSVLCFFYIDNSTSAARKNENPEPEKK